MSFTAFRAAASNMGKWPKGVTLPGKLVLFALANRHNQETGRCDPSVKTIAKDLGISERSVQEGLRSLEQEGLIVTVERVQRSGRGRKNLTNRYRLASVSMGEQSAGGRVNNLHPKQEPYSQPSAWDDLVMLVEDDRLEEASQGMGAEDGAFPRRAG